MMNNINFTESSSELELREAIAKSNAKLAQQALKTIRQTLPNKIFELNRILEQNELFNFKFNLSNQTDDDIKNLPSATYKPSKTILSNGSLYTSMQVNNDSLNNCCCKSSQQLATNQILNYPNGPIDVNQKVIELFSVLTPQLNDAIEISLQIVAGLNTLVPKAEDGNNTGVDIQDTAMTVINDFKNLARDQFDSFACRTEKRGKTLSERYYVCVVSLCRSIVSKHFSTYELCYLKILPRLLRLITFTILIILLISFIEIGDLVAKIVKHPQSMDFRLELKVHDEDCRVELVMIGHKLRNTYVLLYDYFMKNFERIVKPRGDSHVDSMY